MYRQSQKKIKFIEFSVLNLDIKGYSIPFVRACPIEKWTNSGSRFLTHVSMIFQIYSQQHFVSSCYITLSLVVSGFSVV